MQSTTKKLSKFDAIKNMLHSSNKKPSMDKDSKAYKYAEANVDPKYDMEIYNQGRRYSNDMTQLLGSIERLKQTYKSKDTQLQNAHNANIRESDAAISKNALKRGLVRSSWATSKSREERSALLSSLTDAKGELSRGYSKDLAGINGKIADTKLSDSEDYSKLMSQKNEALLKLMEEFSKNNRYSPGDKLKIDYSYKRYDDENKGSRNNRVPKKLMY